MAENKAIMPMADYTAICDAVRAKKGTTDTYKSGELATAISSIEGGGGSRGRHTGHIDAAGLLAIGWEQDDIDWLQERVFWDEEDDDKWSVATNGADKFPNNLTSFPDGDFIAATYSGTNVKYNSNFRCIFQRAKSGATIRSVRYLKGAKFVDYSRASFSESNVTLASFFYQSSIAELKYPSGNNYITNYSSSFQVCSSLEYIDLSKMSVGVKPTTFSSTFSGCFSLVCADLTDIDTSACTTFANMFNNNSLLREVKGVLDLSAATNITSMFAYCYFLDSVFLKNVGISIDLSYSTMLKKECILYLLNNAQSVSSGTINLGATNLAKLTDDEKAIAINKGWTLA